jgi:hypothetical protein
MLGVQKLAGADDVRVHHAFDPPHRHSSHYVGAMAEVPRIQASIAAIVVVHRYRRSPFGGGKHAKTGKLATLRFLEAPADVCLRHPLLIMLASAILHDHGILPSMMFTDPHIVLGLLREYGNSPVGPPVELRRWWTTWDASACIDKFHHSILFARFVEDVENGKNPLIDTVEKAGASFVTYTPPYNDPIYFSKVVYTRS